MTYVMYVNADHSRHITQIVSLCSSHPLPLKSPDLVGVRPTPIPFKYHLCLNAVQGAAGCQDGHALQQLAIKLSPEHSSQVTAGAFKPCLLLPMSLNLDSQLQEGGPSVSATEHHAGFYPSRLSVETSLWSYSVI